MRYKLIVGGFLLSILIIAATGIYALNISRQIITSFEKGEKHFGSIASAATEVCSYVKRAEGHFMLYMVFNRNLDKEKLPKRIQSLKEQITILDEKVKHPEARALVDEIKARTHRIQALLDRFLETRDQDLKASGQFQIKNHSEAIFTLHENFSTVRKLGVQLAKFEIKLENETKTAVLKRASILKFYIVFILGIMSVFTLYMVHTIYQIIKRLNREIDSRIQSEKILQQEKDKLKKAIEKVKILSGLLPICAACKKIRDDKGYWNQIESYIKTHSEARFTHGICPECAKKLYPDIEL